MTCNHEFEILDPSSIDCSGLAPEQVQAAYEGINNLANLVLIDSENLPSLVSVSDGVPLYLSTAGTIVLSGSPIACRFIGTKVGDYLNPVGKILELTQGVNIGACKYLRDDGAGVLVETTCDDESAIAISLTPTQNNAECRKVLLLGVTGCSDSGTKTNVFTSFYTTGYTIEEEDENVRIKLPAPIISQDGSAGWTVGINGGLVTPKDGSWLLTGRWSGGIPIPNDNEVGIEFTFIIEATGIGEVEREIIQVTRTWFPQIGIPVERGSDARIRKTFCLQIDNVPAGTEFYCSLAFRGKWGNPASTGYFDLHRFNISEIFNGF